MRSPIPWELLLLIFTVTACSTQPSSKQVANELKTVTSWTATAHMVGNFWLEGKVPHAYAKQTLQTAQKKLQEEIDTLAEVTPAENRKTVINEVEMLRETVGQMAKTVDQKDRNALTKSIEQLSNQEQAIHNLAKAVGGQS
ncbi:hypothetical protein NIES25_45340 [Nostoc linckia NIES-25]|nr:hypothetical protein NIES25_45340 [Nostoc linckia NIES-25]